MPVPLSLGNANVTIGELKLGNRGSIHGFEGKAGFASHEMPRLRKFFSKEYSGYKIVLVCNGPTGSMHAENFDMVQMVGLMPFDPNVVYIFTQRQPCEFHAFFTDDITQRAPGGSDFNAISYLSTFCSVIVGRCSGAQMPCETRRNWMDPSKTLLSFTHHDNGASFVRDPAALGLKMRRVHSAASTPEEAAEVLKSVL